jgi:hypothetical protein
VGALPARAANRTDEKKRIRPVLWEGTEFTLPAATVFTRSAPPDFGCLPPSRARS